MKKYNYITKKILRLTYQKKKVQTQPEMNIFTINGKFEEEKSFEDIKEIIKIIKKKLENNKIIIKSIENSNNLDVKIIRK